MHLRNICFVRPIEPPTAEAYRHAEPGGRPAEGDDDWTEPTLVRMCCNLCVNNRKAIQITKWLFQYLNCTITQYFLTCHFYNNIVFQFSNILMFQYLYIPISQYSNTSTFKYINVQKFQTSKGCFPEKLYCTCFWLYQLGTLSYSPFNLFCANTRFIKGITLSTTPFPREP